MPQCAFVDGMGHRGHRACLLFRRNTDFQATLQISRAGPARLVGPNAREQISHKGHHTNVRRGHEGYVKFVRTEEPSSGGRDDAGVVNKEEKSISSDFLNPPNSCNSHEDLRAIPELEGDAV